jgi:hypothetical protein
MPPEVRAETLRVMLTMTGGIPALTPAEAVTLGAHRLTYRDVGLLGTQCADDLALLNACLDAEQESRAHEFAALERLLPLLQWSDGTLDERIVALPQASFARAALLLYTLGWVTPTKED